MTIQTLGGITLVALLAALTVGVSRSPRFAGLTFTTAVATCVAAALCFPFLFLTVGGYTLTGLIVPLIQIIMFGMGTTLSLGDFARVLVMPRGVLVGLLLQFGVMPVTGYTLATLFGFTGEVAAGVVLVGAAPGGVASNVMTYLAGGNVALSVTMTAFSTLLSPVLTPLAMQWLAGRFVPIDAWAMMISILKMIIIPIQRVQMALGVRKSWLDKTGEKFPETWEDVQRIAVKFKEGDPDGNGKADTFAMALQAAKPRDLIHMLDLFTFGSGLRGTLVDANNSSHSCVVRVAMIRAVSA